jgi:YVTN family beta-propeller protein
MLVTLFGAAAPWVLEVAPNTGFYTPMRLGSYKASWLLLGALALTACAQAAAEPELTITSLEPLPPVTTAPTTTQSLPEPNPNLAEGEANLAEGEATTTTQSLAEQTSNLAEVEATTTLPPTTGLELVEAATIRGDISPKSIVASGNGLFFAQNMMYRHTVTVYDEDYELVATIDDSVDLTGDGTLHQGAPVEAVPTSDGEYMYVSNYQMYGPGYSRAGGDGCNLGGWDESFVYRISTSSLEIDQVIPAGAVPKFLAITPDDSTVLVSNWCSFDMSVIDTATATEVARVELGRHPRGIAVTSDGATAFVAVMGSTNIAVVDLATLQVDWIKGVGSNPRHLVLSPDDRYLYATLNGDGRVIRIRVEDGEVLDRVRTGSAPRSMTISDDGLSLYVVNYESDTVAKVDTTTMEISQTIAVPHHPIGITFDNANREVWVASYSGFITVFREIEPSQ